MKLKELATIWGGSTPATKNKKLWLNEIPFITPNFISKNKINVINNFDRLITNNNFNFSKKNDILLTCRAPVGIVAINNLEKCWFSQGIKNIRTGKFIRPKYLCYWFYKNKNVLIANSFGTTFLEISKNSLENMELNLIPLEKQQQIINMIEPFEKLLEILKKKRENINNLLVQYYFFNKTNKFTTLNQICKIKSLKYDKEKEYVDTRNIGFSKYIGSVMLGDKRPSRANIVISENSIIVARMKGDTKVFPIISNYFKSKVYSTGFIPIVSNVLPYIYGWIISRDFEKNKNNLTTGTVMSSLNNTAFNTIKILAAKTNINNKFGNNLLMLHNINEELIIILEKVINLLIKQLIQ